VGTGPPCAMILSPAARGRRGVLGERIHATYLLWAKNHSLLFGKSANPAGTMRYVSVIFAVEVLQTLYRRVVVRGMRPSLAAVALSVLATVQHFALESDPTASTESHWGRS
jgi:hypothetical protein